jgi:hypothetical protein
MSDQTFVPGPSLRTEAPVVKEGEATEPPIRAVPVPYLDAGRSLRGRSADREQQNAVSDPMSSLAHK